MAKMLTATMALRTMGLLFGMSLPSGFTQRSATPNVTAMPVESMAAIARMAYRICAPFGPPQMFWSAHSVGRASFVMPGMPAANTTV